MKATQTRCVTPGLLLGGLVFCLSASAIAQDGSPPAETSSRAQKSAATERLTLEASTARRQISFHTGEARLLSLDRRVHTITAANPELLKITAVAPDELLMQALGIGVTGFAMTDERDVRHWFDVVITTDVRELGVALERLYPEYSIEIVPVAASVVLRGTVSNPTHVTQIVAVAEQFYPTVLNHMVVDEPNRDVTGTPGAAPRIPVGQRVVTIRVRQTRHTIEPGDRVDVFRYGGSREGATAWVPVVRDLLVFATSGESSPSTAGDSGMPAAARMVSLLGTPDETQKLLASSGKMSWMVLPANVVGPQTFTVDDALATFDRALTNRASDTDDLRSELQALHTDVRRLIQLLEARQPANEMPEDVNAAAILDVLSSGPSKMSSSDSDVTDWHEDRLWQIAGVRLSVCKDAGALKPYRGGLTIEDVRQGSTAARAGVREGDILVGLGPWETGSLSDLAYVLNQKGEVGTELSFVVVRKGQALRGKWRVRMDVSSAPRAKAARSVVRIRSGSGPDAQSGSGVVVQVLNSSTLVLTTRDLVTDIDEASGRIEVSLPGHLGADGEVVSSQARVVIDDENAGLVLLELSSSEHFPAIPKAALRPPEPNFRGDVLLAGWNREDAALSRITSRVTDTNKYLGTPNFNCDGKVPPGFSGGAVLNEAGELLGLVVAFDPMDNRTICIDVSPVRSMVDEYLIRHGVKLSQLDAAH